jgi:hypothetical protein
MFFWRLREEPPDNRQHTGKYWLGLCVCFLFVSLFSAGFITSRAEHDCCGEGCPVCIQIQWVENFFRQLRSFSSPPLFSVSALPVTVIVLKIAVLNLIPVTSVNLKVKLNR